MHCYISNDRTDRFSCIDVKYKMVHSQQFFDILKSDLCDYEDVRMVMPDDKSKCGDPEEHPLKQFWAS